MHIQAEANLAALIESTEDLIWSVDLDYRLITFNRALQQNIQNTYDVRIAAGMRFHEVFPPERKALWPQFYERVLAEGPFRVEYTRMDGGIMELAFNPIIVDGETKGISIFGKEITERKRAELLLRDSEERFRATFDQAAVGIVHVTFDGKIQRGNQRFAAIIDYPAEEISGLNVQQITAPEDAAETAALIKRIASGGDEETIEKRYLRKDGSLLWAKTTVSMQRDSQGQPLHLIAFIEDINERKQAEERLAAVQETLRASEVRYRTIFETSADAVILTGVSDGKIIDANQAFFDSAGYERSEVIGRTTQELNIWVNDSDRLRFIDEVAHDGKCRDFEVLSRRKNGEIFWMRLSASKIEIGGIQCRLVFAQDITEAKQAEERLAVAANALRSSEERYRTAFQTSLDAITISREDDGRYVEVNQSFLNMTGYEREEVIGRTSLELQIWLEAQDRQKLAEVLRKDSVCRDMEFQFAKKNGQRFWGLMSAARIEIDGVPSILIVVRDISEAKAVAEALRLSEERYRTVFQTSLDAININRLEDGAFIDCNQAFLDTMGYKREEVMGRTTRELGVWANLSDRQTMITMLSQNSSCQGIEIQFKKNNGEVFWGEMTASHMNVDGVPCILSITRDLSAAKAAEKTIRSLAFYDPLTGLPNRRMLMERLHHPLDAGAGNGRTQALLLIDLDHFKTLNDTLGHQTGDILLQEVARRIVACAHEADTVCRLGGDEFVVLLEDLSKTAEEAAAQAQTAGEKILAVIDQPLLIGDHECHSTASIGITVFADKKDSTDELLQQAEIALYQAKAAGRDSMRFFSPALQAAVNARAAMEEDLHQGIKEKRLLLYYQPQVERSRLTGVEALVRWEHPRHGIVEPKEFIPLAEESRLILPLGDWVLEAACEQIALWAGRMETAHLSVAVNISALQFRQPSFVAQVLATLSRTGANPGNLRLELTESMLVNNLEDIIAKMTELKSHGVRFSLDDFGTGYSSLTYLKRLPLNRLKIDRSFVRDMMVDATSGAIAQTILSLGRAMGISVIAEGVETEEQRGYLAGLGCHSFQGFLFSHPLPLEKFEAFLQGFAEHGGSR